MLILTVDIMAAQRAVILKLVLFYLLIYLSTIKKKCFNQPDGISITLLKEDMFTGKNLLLSSVFCSCHKRKFALRSQKNSILLMLLILCGDIESQPGPNQFTREEFQPKFLSGKGLKIVHQNIRGILSNLDTLEEFITSHSNIDIISLSETHLNDDNAICCKINGYTFLFKNRRVAFYIKENITFERRFYLENSLTESIWIQINQKNSKPFLVGCFYKPPETSKYLQKNYNELLLNDLTRVSKQNNETIILGDFNINYHDPANGKNFKSLFSQMGFKQLIKKSTRITEQSSTWIDLLFSNQPSKISSSCVVSTSLSDHDMIACTRKLNSQKFAPKTITSRNFARYNVTDVTNDVSCIDWQPYTRQMTFRKR